MNVTVDKRLEDFIDALVRSGRRDSASAVLSDGPRLVEERQAKLRSLRETVEASSAEDGLLTAGRVEGELSAHIEVRKALAARCAIRGAARRRFGI